MNPGKVFLRGGIACFVGVVRSKKPSGKIIDRGT